MMRRTNVAAAAVAALLLLWPAAGHAQSKCDDALHEAQKSYDLGLFDDVPGQLAPCLGVRISQQLAIQVHSLLARTYLELEDLTKARSAISTVLRLDSTFDPGPAPRFAALVDQVRREEQTTQVASVSKTSESLREAPATVTVITGEEIARRGYVDLEQLLHDLPGFDVSRLNGAYYSIIYQRGYNSPSNDRDLLLIDGVEQNNLDFGSVYLSRQFPLSNIDRVEVIYGPASTMYGASAYTGVISIITKTPEAMIGEGKSYALQGHVTGGGYDARAVDMTAAGKDPSGTVTWSMTARYQKNQERDLSNLDPWDFTFKNYDFKRIMHLDPSPYTQLLCGVPSPYYACDSSGMSLTDAGQNLVRKLDADAVRNGGYSWGDSAKNWYVQGTARIANLTLGMQLWRSQEGQATGFPVPGSPSWTPKNLSVYLKYALPLGPVKLSIFSRFQQSSTERSTSDFTIMHGYDDTFLSMFSLVPPCVSFLDPVPLTCAPATPWVEDIRSGDTSSQIRTEATGVWEPNPRLSVVGGVEIAKGNIQGEEDQVSTGGPAAGFVSFPDKPPTREHSDYAAYGQGSWRATPSVKLTLAGRMTYDQLNNRPGQHGFGSLFTPRAAVVYAPPRAHYVVKAIYSEAFKDPPDRQKYGRGFTFNNAYVSNGLQPERVRNAEVNALWDPSDRTSVEGSVYQAHYTHVVGYGFDRLPDGSLNTSCLIGCEQWQNRDNIHVRGLQMTARHRIGRGDVWANYTHTESIQVDPNDFFGNPMLDAEGNRLRSLQVAGIAREHVNVGVDTPVGRRLEAGLRADYVGPRKMGPGTTLPAFLLRPAVSVPADTTLDAVLTYRELLPNTALQVSAFNLLNRQYYDPGTEPGSQVQILQAGRTIYVRLIFGLRLRK